MLLGLTPPKTSFWGYESGIYTNQVCLCETVKHALCKSTFRIKMCYLKYKSVHSLKGLNDRVYYVNEMAITFFLSQEKAAKWKTSDGQMDGLTTNGVLVMHPRLGFTEDSKPGVWREISVCGNVFTLRETRSAQQRGKMVSAILSILGITLQTKDTIYINAIFLSKM